MKRRRILAINDEEQGTTLLLEGVAMDTQAALPHQIGFRKAATSMPQRGKMQKQTVRRIERVRLWRGKRHFAGAWHRCITRDMGDGSAVRTCAEVEDL